MEKLELKLRNLDYFLMKLEGVKVEEKLQLMECNKKMKELVKLIKEEGGKNEVVQMGENSSGSTSSDSGSSIEEEKDKGRRK